MECEIAANTYVITLHFIWRVCLQLTMTSSELVTTMMVRANKLCRVAVQQFHPLPNYANSYHNKGHQSLQTRGFLTRQRWAIHERDPVAT